MLPTLHHGQRIPICHANAKEIRSPSSDQTFAKEIGAPTSIIADMSGEQMSHDIRKFCNDIGTTLWALEEGTPLTIVQ